MKPINNHNVYLFPYRVKIITINYFEDSQSQALVLGTNKFASPLGTVTSSEML